MNILFRYHDAIHAQPLIRVQPELAALGIEVDIVAGDTVPPRVGCHYDGIIAHPECLTDDSFGSTPVIALDRIDGAQLGFSRRFIYRLAGVIKGYVLDPPELNNTVSGRMHGSLLHEAGVQPTGKSVALPGRPALQVPQNKLDKIRPGYGFGARGRFQLHATGTVDLDRPRRLDMHFAGCCEYSGSEIETHRRAALRIAQEWPGPATSGNGRPFHGQDYLNVLRDTKVVLSPWGLGEACYRDYEALAAGCVLVKPYTGHVYCVPDIYVAGATYVPCSVDLSDVEEIIAAILDNWDVYRPMRDRGIALAASAWSADRIAYNMEHQIRGILE